jgi:hypothetical protein
MLLGMGSSAISIITRRLGDLSNVEVVDVPANCKWKHNKIYFSYNSKTYPLKISRGECERQKFKIGQPLQLYYHSYFDNFERLGKTPEIEFLGLLVISVLIYFAIRRIARG